MQKSRRAVTKVVAQDGKHTTIVDESLQAAVTDEHVRPHRHEEITSALDKEIHQDHHYTIVQPINTVESLPEKHTHKTLAIQHKTVDHRNEQGILEELNAEASHYKDTSVIHETTYSTSTSTISGEHVHHHIHEHIQPVIRKETRAPEYVHTTVPIHEVHHQEAKYHGTSVLAPITMEEFEGRKALIGDLKERRVREFDGCPKAYERMLNGERGAFDGDHMHSTVV